LQIAGSDEDHKPCKPQYYYSSVPKSFRKIELKYDFTNREKAERMNYMRRNKNGTERKKKTYNATKEPQT
jgi:hypothetical protein